MLKASELKKLGITDSTLRFSLSCKKIEINGDDIIVLNDSFYDAVFFKIYKDKEKFRYYIDTIKNSKAKNYYEFLFAILFLDRDSCLKFMRKVDSKKYDISVFRSILERKTLKKSSYTRFPEYLEDYIKIVDVYINEGKSVLGAKILEYIFEYDDNLYLRVLLQLCLKMEDDLDYVVNPYIYRDAVVLEKYRQFERELVFYLDMKQLDKVEYLTDFLSDIYGEQETNFFSVITLFLKRIKASLLNRDDIGSRIEYGVMGDLDSVLVTLLAEGDIYRIKEIVEEQNKNDSHNIKCIIYKKLFDILYRYIQRNTDNVVHRVGLCAVEDNKIDECIVHHKVSSISLDLFKSFEDGNIDPFYEDVNYFRKYEEYLANKDYKNALLAIRKFQYVMKKIGVNVCFDYIEKDLITLIKMSQDPDNDMHQYNKYFELGLSSLKDWKYREALTYLLRAMKFVKTPTSLLLSKIAQCYYNLGNLDSAISFYNKAAKQYLYPEDILEFIECLFIKGHYRRLIGLVEVYEKYYSLENPRIHYMSSIAEAYLRNFKNAISELEITEMIIKEMYSVEYHFTYERGILEEIQKDNCVPCYTMDTFIDFELTEHEKKFKERLDEYLTVITDPVYTILSSIDQDKESFEEKMDYLFTLLKVLLVSNRRDDALNVYKVIEQRLSSYSDDCLPKENFTLILKNYRNL